MLTDNFLPTSYLLVVANLYGFARQAVDHPYSFYPVCSALPKPQTAVQELIAEIASTHPVLLQRTGVERAIANLSNTQRLCLMNIAEEFSSKVNVLQSFAVSAYRAEMAYLRENVQRAPNPKLPLPIVLLRRVYYRFTWGMLSKQKILEWKMPAVYEQWVRFKAAKWRYLFKRDGAASESCLNGLNYGIYHPDFDGFEQGISECLKQLSKSKEFCFPLDYAKSLEVIVEQMENSEIPLLKFPADQSS